MNCTLRLGIIGNDKVTMSKFESLDKHENINLTYLNASSINNNLTEIDVVLTTMEWSPKWRIMIDECRRQKIPSYYLIDGVIDWDYMWNNWQYIKKDGNLLQPLLSDRIGVVSNYQSRFLSSIGLKDRVDIIGIPRFDKQNNEENISNSNRILVTTSNTPFLNSYAETYVKKALSDLKDFFFKNKSYKVVWKIDNDLARKINIKNNKNGDIDSLLNNISATISFPSTVLLESMLKKIPTALIDYRNVPQLINTAWKITKSSDIKNVVENLLNPDHEFLSYQEFCLSDNLLHGNATNRLVYNLFKVSNKDEKVLNLNLKPDQFEYKNRIKQINSHITSFKIVESDYLQYALDGYRKELSHLNGIIEYINHLILKAKISKKNKFSEYFILKHIIEEMEDFIKHNR